MAKDYNKTIHLPATDFPMRAGLPKREPALLNGEYEVATYKKIMERNADKPSFVLHDGPPYANGDIHIGTALNKILKDMIVRYKNMTGYRAPYVPGWDTHGLPIESAILKNKKIKRDELSDVEFRDKCREYALSYVDRQREEFQRLGVIGDWNDPYLTLKPEFEAAQIRVFGKMAEKGYIYKGLKPVYWCYTDETALAEAEIEYQDDPCTTIFVKFKVKDDKGKLASLTDLSKTYFVIWTTTAWTLPGNRAISVNPDSEYVLLKAENGEVYIVAKELSEAVCKAAGLENTEIIATLDSIGGELFESTVCTADAYENRYDDVVKFVDILYQACDALAADEDLAVETVVNWYTNCGKTLTEDEARTSIQGKPFITSAEAKEITLGEFATSYASWFESRELIDSTGLENVKANIASDVFADALK